MSILYYLESTVKKQSCVGDDVWCPACQSMGKIAPDQDKLSTKVNGRIPALNDDLCLCKCSPPPKLVHSQTTFRENVSQLFLIPLKTKRLAKYTQVELIKIISGPAAFFYCVQKSSPKDYERMVWELWKTGKTSINNLAINVPKQTRRPHSYFRNDNGKPKISGIDWMTMGGLRGSSNTLMAYQSPDDDTSAISTPNEVEEWFTKAGFALKETFIQNSIHNHQLINKYVKRPNHYVVSLVDSAIISDIRKVKPNVPNHWIVWSSPLAHIDGRAINNGVKDSDKVKMTCFSWGNYNKPLRKNCTYGEFKVLHYMCYIFVK